MQQSSSSAKTFAAPSATSAMPSQASEGSAPLRAMKRFSPHQFSTFVAQEARVEIIPKFTLPAVRCMSGTFGPFMPSYPLVVPLWLALYLRQTDTCTMTPPAFLSRGFLERLLERESQTEATFEMLHFHFFEIAKLFFEHAQDDLPECGEVMRLVPEILARRREKILQSVSAFQDATQSLRIPALKVSNLVSVELHFLRASFCRTLNIAADLERRSVVIGPQTTAAAAAVNSSMVTPARPSEGTTIAVTEASTTGSRSEREPSRATEDLGSRADDMDGDLLAVGTGSVATGAPSVAKKRRTLRQR